MQAGWVWDERGTVNVCIRGQSLKGVGSRESPTGVVVEVLGICILHLANLQCGQQRVIFMWGSGQVGTIFCAGKKENPLDSIFV